MYAIILRLSCSIVTACMHLYNDTPKYNIMQCTILDVFGALDTYTPPPKARPYQPLFCLSASLMYSNLDSYKNRHELQVSKGVLRVWYTVFLLFFRLRKENACRPGERHRYIHIMNIQRALMASTYTFQSTSALKPIFAWRERKTRDMICAMAPSAVHYIPLQLSTIQSFIV